MTSLTSKEKESVALLSIGTMLEYFDFFLYIHLATLLNQVFFAPTDEKSSALLASFAYCSSVVFRPMGALIFGYIGDKHGRKAAINLSLLLMGVSCLGIFFLPSYEKIGIAASVAITIFRALQGVTSMSEIVGAEILIVENIKGKKVFIALMCLGVGCFFGGQLALHSVNYALQEYFNWRYLFMIGLLIFVIRAYSVHRLIEPIQNINTYRSNEKTNIATLLALYVANCLQPVSFYICVMGLGNILKTKFGFSNADLVNNNLIGFYSYFVGLVIFGFLSKYIEPIKITTFRSLVTIMIYLLSPFLLKQIESATDVTIIQCAILFFGLGDFNLSAYIYKAISNKKYTTGALAFSISRAIITIITTYFLAIMQDSLKEYTYLVFGGAFSIAYYFAIKRFESVDKASIDGHHSYYRN